MVGMVLAGILMRFSGRLPFYVAAGVALTIALILVGITRSRHPVVFPETEIPISPVNESDWDHAQRRAALGSIFMAFLVIGGVTTQFPKLATQLGNSTSLIGLTMGFLPLWRTLGFGFFGRWKDSPNISRPLFLVKLILGAAMALLVIANSSTWFMVAFALLGLVSAATFSFSQYLCLRNPAQAGRRIGYHESSMLGGIVLGSILSGWLAQGFGFHVTFGFGIVLSALALIAQPALFYRRARQHGNRSLSGEAG
jgi:MFS family permease